MAGEVRIEIVAEDRSGPTMARAEQGMQGLGRSGASAGVGFETMARGAQRAANYVERGYSIMTRLDLTQISLQQSQVRVTTAQERYTQAVRDHGPASQQAVNANRELEASQAALEKTQLRARLSYVMIAADVVTMAAQIPAAVRALSALRLAQFATAASGALMMTTMTAGIAAVGIVAGIIAVTVALDKFKASTDVASAGVIELDGNVQELGATMVNLKDGAFSMMESGLQKVGVSLDNLPLEKQRALMIAFGYTVDDMAVKLLEAKAAEDSLTAAALDLDPTLLAQVETQRRKGETNHELAERLGLTVEQEAELEAQGRFTTEGIISQTEAQRRLNSEQGGGGASGNGASAAASFGAMLPSWAAEDLRRTGLTPQGHPDNRRWDLESMLNTGPGVDVTGIGRGVYAPYGGGFASGGQLGSTDLAGAYGSRTNLNGIASNNAQGSRDVNMGGVTVVQYINGGNPQAVANATVGAMTQVNDRAAAARVG